MRNLKRMLTMIMAVAMLMSLMVVGAGAAFPDQDEIKHADAVQKMVSLNIIEGRDDGSFDPTAIVTRGEMAKMICVALNGGNDPKLSSGTVVSFTDTKGHWAEGYIEYCVNMGIVNGLGDGTFGPDQGVTATQAAKMLLVALGYDAEYEKFVGLTWALNVNKTAMQKGLYEDIMGIDANAPMSRDDAAQMLSNFTTTYMVKYEFGIGGGGNDIVGVKQAVDTNETVLSKYFKLVEENGQLTQIGYDEKKAEYKYTVDGSTFQSENDYSALFGANVTVMWRDKDNNGNYSITTDSVYDIILNDSSVVATGVMDDFGKYDTGKKTLEFADVTYDVNSAVSTMRAYDGEDANALKAGDPATIENVTGAYNVSLLDNDNDGKVDLVVYQPFKVAKVTYAGSTSTTFDNGVGSVDNDDVVLYDGIAKDDLVAYYEKANTTMGKDTAVKLDVQTGTISGVKNGEYLIDGTWYKNTTNTKLNVNDNIEYVAVGSTIYYAKMVEAGDTTKDVLVVSQVAPATGLNSGVDAKVMLTDGTEKVVNVEKLNGKTAKNTGDASTDDSVVVPGQMYTYKVNSDGAYELKSLSTTNTAGYDGYYGQAKSSGGYDKATETVLGKDLADNAKVFVVKTSSTPADVQIDLFTGKEIKNNGQDLKEKATALTTKANGFETVQLATIYGDSITLPTNIKGSNYGYLTADAYNTSADGKNYVNYTIWNGTEEVTVKEEDTNDASLKAGQVITFDNAGDGLVKNVTKVAGTAAPVTGYDSANSKKVAINGTSYDIDSDDTTILYVDTKNTKGVDGGEIQLAQDKGDGSYIPNVFYVANNSNMLNVLVVDVNNDYDTTGVGEGDKIDLPADDASAIQDALNKGAEVTVTGSEMTGTLNVPAEANLTVAGGTNGDVAIKGNVTVDATAKMTLSGNVTVAEGATLTNNGSIVGDETSGSKQGMLMVAGGATYIENGETIVGKAEDNALFTADKTAQVQIGIFDDDNNSYKIRGTGNVTLNKDLTLAAKEYIHVKGTEATTLKIADGKVLTLQAGSSNQDCSTLNLTNGDAKGGKIIGGKDSKITFNGSGTMLLYVKGTTAENGFVKNDDSASLDGSNNHYTVENGGFTWDATSSKWKMNAAG